MRVQEVGHAIELMVSPSERQGDQEQIIVGGHGRRPGIVRPVESADDEGEHGDQLAFLRCEIFGEEIAVLRCDLEQALVEEIGRGLGNRHDELPAPPDCLLVIDRQHPRRFWRFGRGPEQRVAEIDLQAGT
jgi:hypothetical protein